MRVAAILAVLLCLAFEGATAFAATYTITADRDSLLKQLDVNGNFGNDSEILIKNSSGSDLHRAIVGFTLPSLAAGEVITSATLNFQVTQSDTQLISVHRVTDTWAENTVTWGNTGTDFAATAEGSFTPSSGNRTLAITTLVRGWYDGTYANNGVMLMGPNGIDSKIASSEWGTSGQRPRLVIVTVQGPVLMVVKSATAFSDPFNGTTNPKAIPGAVMTYTVSVSNSANGSATSGTTVITDAVPANMEMFVGNIGGAGSGPVAFTNGTPSSGLTYTYTSLASTTDSISFSNNGGATYTYTPVSVGGYDANVTNFRVNPGGSFAAKTGASNPGFTMQLRMRVK
jgi:uncharacterized repeat protein (TIGR01451 family)